MLWRGFWKTTIWVIFGTSAGLYAVLVLLDPYNSIAFSLPIDRAPVVTNQRYSYPAVARDKAFDSLIVGTSTTRLLRPEKMNEALGGRFANLSLNSGTAYEQSQLLHLFVRHHPRPRAVVIGLDIVWCRIGETEVKFTQVPFPPWLYDENPWNDLLHLFNLPILEPAGRLIAYSLGWREARYRKDGYANFLPPRSAYDLLRVRKSLYGGAELRQHAPQQPPAVISPAERASWTFPSHRRLDRMLSALPAGTHKVLLFVPYHHFHQPVEGSRSAAQWRECKTRLARLASAYANSHVIDFMIPSPITLRDANYWDPLHFGTATADRLTALIGEAVQEDCGRTAAMDYLVLAAPDGERSRVCAAALERGRSPPRTALEPRGG